MRANEVETVQRMFFSAALVFEVDENGRLPSHVTYKIRQNASFTQDTKSIRLSFWRPDPFAWDFRYYMVSWINGSRQVGLVVKDITIDARGLWFVSQAGQIGHSVANGSPPLRCFFGAVLSRR